MLQGQAQTTDVPDVPDVHELGFDRLLHQRPMRELAVIG
jgi:hypothetical protein